VVARLGGVAMFLGFLGATLSWVPLTALVVAILVGSTLVFALGMVDDLHRMPPYTKLVFQLLIVCVAVLLGVRIELLHLPWLSIPFSVLWFVLVMNAFNLLDNMDGLAAGVGAMAAGFCAFHAALAQQWVLVSLDLILCGVCLGFLRFNFPPAKIFMGDSGSHLLGFGLAALAPLQSWSHSTHLLSILAVPALVLAVPIFDMCFVTIQRLAHRRHPFAGGTDHVSHRLAILGLSARQTVLALYGVSACLGAVSLLSATMKPLSALAVWCVVLTGLLLVGRYLAQVKVYRLEPQPSGISAAVTRPITLIETMLLHKRRVVEILVDFCIVSSAYVFAYLLRFEGVLSAHLQRLIIQSLPVILLIKLACFAGCGLYRRVWRYTDLSDVLAVFKAVTLGSVLSSLALLYVWRFEGYSRAVVVIDWMLSFLAVGGSRVVERLLDEWIGTAVEQGVPVLIIGAGETGERVLRYLKYEAKGARRVIGFLDDDVRKLGNQLHGVRVLGTRASLSTMLEEYRFREVLIAINDPPGDLLQHIQQCCEPCGVSWKVVTAGVSDAV
jgi:UDP-GlcNAc:undecaprenyl-phosphate GlcNAc-1-phosphate transferase